MTGAMALRWEAALTMAWDGVTVSTRARSVPLEQRLGHSENGFLLVFFVSTIPSARGEKSEGFTV